MYAGSERLEQFTDQSSGGYERLLYVHEDLMGNTRYYTKENGRSFAELTYDAWGMPESPNKLLNNDHGNYVYATYTGHIFDTTLDIYFAEARFYDANTRTWMAVDPIKDGFNWYQYCYSNPLRYWDPLGLVPVAASQQDDENDDGFTTYGGCESVPYAAKMQDASTANSVFAIERVGTFTYGKTGSFAVGGVAAYAIGISTDGRDTKIQASVGGGGGTPNLSPISHYIMITNAPNIDALTGPAYQVGGSISIGISIGVDYVIMVNSETGEEYQGITASFGIGLPLWAEVHGEVSNTVNIFDINEGLVDPLMETYLP